MKKICILLLFAFFAFFSFSQPGDWVWLQGAGNNTYNSTGNFGIKGVASASNQPPALYETCEWTDQNGKFWMYGGLDDNAGIEIHNDLWKYDPTANEWTWMNGTNSLNTAGNYGTKGVVSAANLPPGLGYGVATWVDLSGNFWMFGGYDGSDNSSRSDLWEYNIGTNEWTWMNGPGTGNPAGVYGTQGVPNGTNYPPPRTECAASWVDNAGDLWMFGGYITQLYNDMWRYNIATNTWTWMKGSNLTTQKGNWGTMGVESSSNEPSARRAYCHWKDYAGNLWMYGGDGLDSSGTSWYLCDLWRFNTTTNNWTWMNGQDVGSSTNIGVYGTKCVMAASNQPPPRFENRACWTDPDGNFWMFGGQFQTSPFNLFTLNDLWKYCVTANEWTWEGGDNTPNQAGNWGTMGVTNATNVPSPRNGDPGWTDGKWHIYTFGGTSGSFGSLYNDLWEFTIDSTCGTPCTSEAALAPVAAFESNDSSFCPGNCINFTDLSTNSPTSWLWSFPGATPSSSTSQNPSGICYSTVGTYTVTLTATNSWGSNTDTKSNFITVLTSPPTPTISWSDDTLYSSTNVAYVSYQWYKSGFIVAGGTKSWLYIGTDTATYTVVVRSSNGCVATASISARALPIELISFDAAYNGKTVDLNWATASEINNDFFTIERTKDGINFLPVVKVNGAGTSNRLLYYHAVDDYPLFGVSAYRLKQTDFDGKYQYSSMVAVDVQSGNKLAILSLNTSGDDNSLHYFISSSSGDPFNIEITDRTGKIMVSKTSTENIGTINFFEFAHGIYLFRAFNDYVSSERKFVY